MDNPAPTNFASMLRQYRQATGMTQAELAERAHLSPEAIGALERGTRRAPRKDTIDLLAEALALTDEEQAAFEATARQHRMASPLASASPTTPSAAPLETTPVPQNRLALPSGLQSLIQVVQRVRSLPSRTLRVLVAGLVVVLGASVLVTGGRRAPPFDCGAPLMGVRLIR